MLRDIYDSTIKFLAPQSLQEVYTTALNEAMRLTQSNEGTVYLAKNGKLTRVYSSLTTNHVQPRESGYSYECYHTGKTILVTTKMLRESHPQILKSGMKSVVMIPLAHHQKNIGVLTLRAKKERHFTKGRLETLRLFGSLVSLAIQKNQLYVETVNTLRNRDLFISMAAHELRTPITTILGYLQLMNKKYEKNEMPSKKWVETAYSESIRLKNLIYELLQIEQIKKGQLKYEWNNNSLREILERVVNSAQIANPNYKIVFEDKLNGENDILYSDYDKIIQAIINLINNSIKFSTRGSEIKVILSFHKPYFIISVADQGQGISKKDLPHVFEGFYKGKDNTKQGMGLGLFLTENIVQRHKGLITIESELGKGTQIDIKLPKR